MIESRKDSKDFILKIEQEFPVNQWKVNQIHIWPILRYHLFFWMIRAIEGNRLVEKKEVQVSGSIVPEGFVAIVSGIFRYFGFLRKLQPKENLFFSPNHVRVNYESKFFDRFFDSIIQLKSLRKSSYLFDYHQENKSDLPVENQEIYFSLLAYNKGFKFWHKLMMKLGLREKAVLQFELEGYQDFLDFLKLQGETQGFATKYHVAFLRQYFTSIFEGERFFDEILQRTKPKDIFIICYYTPFMHSLLLAAKKRNIKVTEVQHGPMSNTHLSYTHWTKVPVVGYEFLPDAFWCWDKTSLETMQLWTDQTTKHDAFLGGNPWVDFLKSKQMNVVLPNNVMLYTLQPLSFEVLFPEPLLQLMKQKKWIWYIRLHPRQLNQMQELETFLKNNKVFDVVNIKEAYDLPLPVLLEKCVVHLTHFSGSAIEAAMMNKFTIVLDKLGEDTFKEIIQNQKAIYLPIDDQFADAFETIITKL